MENQTLYNTFPPKGRMAVEPIVTRFKNNVQTVISQRKVFQLRLRQFQTVS